MPPKRRVKPITNIDDPRYVKALAHPLRLRILARLAEEDASPVQLAGQLDSPLGTVAYHFQILEKLGLIEMVATRQRRGAVEHVYAVRGHPRFSDAAWGRSGQLTKQAVISSILAEIGEYVTRSAAAGGFDRADAHFTRTTLKLDDRGWSEIARATNHWLQQVQNAEEKAHARLQDSGAEPLDAGLVILFFEGNSRTRATPSRSVPARAAGTHSSEGTADRR